MNLVGSCYMFTFNILPLEKIRKVNFNTKANSFQPPLLEVATKNISKHIICYLITWILNGKHVRCVVTKTNIGSLDKRLMYEEVNLLQYRVRVSTILLQCLSVCITWTNIDI